MYPSYGSNEEGGQIPREDLVFLPIRMCPCRKHRGWRQFFVPIPNARPFVMLVTLRVSVRDAKRTNRYIFEPKTVVEAPLNEIL